MARARLAIEEVLARPRHVLLAAVVAGLLVAPVASRAVALALVVALLAAGAATRRHGLAIVASAGLLLGAATGEARLAAGERSAPALGRALSARVVVLEPVRRRAFGGWSVAARVLHGRDRGGRVVVRGPGRVRRPTAGAGDVLRVRGRLVALAEWERNEAV